jgi:hypothetical protein
MSRRTERLTERQAEDALKKLCKYVRMSQMFDSLSKRLKYVTSSYIHLDLLLSRTVRNVFYCNMYS